MNCQTLTLHIAPWYRSLSITHLLVTTCVTEYENQSVILHWEF